MSGSVLDDNCKEHGHDHAEGHGHEHCHTDGAGTTDHFHMTHPDTEWESCLAHAEKIGLGTRQYELKKI